MGPGELNDFIVGYLYLENQLAFGYFRISNGHAYMSQYNHVEFPEFKGRATQENLIVYEEAVIDHDKGIPSGQLNRKEVYDEMIETGLWFHTFDELQNAINSTQ